MQVNDGSKVSGCDNVKAEQPQRKQELEVDFKEQLESAKKQQAQSSGAQTDGAPTTGGGHPDRPKGGN